jgi:hypothetical protein
MMMMRFVIGFQLVIVMVVGGYDSGSGSDCDCVGSGYWVGCDAKLRIITLPYRRVRVRF